MKKSILGFVIIFALAAVCFAQQNDSDEKDGQVILKAGTEFSGELQNNLDIASSKRGDDFTLELTEDVSGAGKTFDKGTDLTGRVSNVKKSETEDGNSEIRVFFDFLKDGSNYLPLKASVISITRDGKPTDLQFSDSPVFANGTIISKKGKKLQLSKGDVFQIKLDEDLKKNK